MTGKSRSFPLQSFSLENTPLGQSGKLNRPIFSVATPQTATQNAHQHGERHLQKTAERNAEIGGLKNSTQNAHQYKPEYHTKVISGQSILEGPRRAMVARLVKQGIKDDKVLAAMGAVPRHQFIEQGLVGQAYVDASLPIGSQQTISQPYIVARMIEFMRNGRALRNVLEIGTGCGYQAAVLSQVCENVYSIERIKVLHELAKKNLRSLRIANLRLHYGDGMLGLPQVAPFDGIILAAAGMQIPDALLQQLAIGGRLIGPVVAQAIGPEAEKRQVLQLIERTGSMEWNNSVLEECYFVPLRPGTI